MRTTLVLFGHNVHRTIKHQWFYRGKIKVIPTTTEQVLKSRGIDVLDLQEFLKPPKEKAEIKIVGMYDRELPRDASHPDYKQEPCYIYGNTNALIEGLEQAKTLTNTVEICEGLPATLLESEGNLNLSDEVHSEAEYAIKLSCMFNAMQDKLPKRKDPLRPMWNFKREYGITLPKKIELLCKNLTTICEKYSTNVKNNSVILDAFFSAPIKAHNKNIQFQTKGEMVITTGKKLKPIAEPSLTHGITLPNFYPMDCTADLTPYHFYDIQDFYPTSINSKWPYVQMAFLNLNLEEVKNIIEEPLTESQIIARGLVHGFSIAVSEARAAFGSDIKKLPEPVVVPIVQTDGKLFHFSIFQLNTLDVDKNSEVKNIFWTSERIPLYLACEYKGGRPFFDGYNPDVIRRLMLFYNIE